MPVPLSFPRDFKAQNAAQATAMDIMLTWTDGQLDGSSGAPTIATADADNMATALCSTDGPTGGDLGRAAIMLMWLTAERDALRRIVTEAGLDWPVAETETIPS